LKLKKLELVGFKSFVEPTTLEFDTPLTGIVGPNGSGKTNILDAIRWAMGEMSAKSLRGRQMEDIIFNGSEKRLPIGMAEVSLTFSTEDGIAPAEYGNFSEITVTRRLYRSGESEYLINKIPSRLKDVIELFLGTGAGHRTYSIIEQGKIDFVINAKPEERRLLLEEAAGVSKFKHRKESALRKMEGTENNLVRLKDILQEINRQINSLDRQVKKAERYKILKNELRERELKSAHFQHHELSRESSELKTLLDEWSVRETSSGASLSTLENEIERGRLELTEKDMGLNSLQERTFEVTSRLQLLEAQQEFRQKEGSQLETSKRETYEEIVVLKGRLETLQREKEEKTFVPAKGTDRSSTLQEAGETWKKLEERREEQNRLLERLREEKHQQDSSLQRLEAEKKYLEERKIASKGQIAKVELEWTAEGERLEEQQKIFQEKEILLKETTDRARALQSEALQLKEEVFSQKERQEILSQELGLRRDDLVMKRSRLKSLLDLEKNLEGYAEGVRSILQKKRNGVYGVVADLIDTAPEYETAVSAALGEKLQYVIVQSHEEGVEAINYLKTQSSGRSTFIPLQVRETTHESFPASTEGVVGSLLQLVQIKEGYQRIGQHLLGDVVLVRTLGDALTLWKANGHQKTLVTLEGEVVDPSGVVSGGTQGFQSKALLEKKREIRELQTLTASLEEEIGLKEDAVSQLEGTLSEKSLTLESRTRQNQEEELKGISRENELRLLETELHQIRQRRERLERTQQELTTELSEVERSLSQWEDQRSELRRRLEAKEQELATKAQESETFEQEARRSQENLTLLRIQQAGALERDSLRSREWERLLETERELRQKIDEGMASMTEAHQKRALLSKSIEESSQELIVLKKLSEELRTSQEESRTHYETLLVSVREKEASVRDLRKENDLAKSHTGDLRVTLSRAESDLSHLEQQITEKYSVNLTDPLPLEGGGLGRGWEDFDKATEDREIAELKEKLDRMGDVNLGAIPEYEELRQRQSFLTLQITDLETSIERLKKAIQKINQTTKMRFENTFALVNEKFQALFPRLFQGGRAEMRFTEDQDLLNAGIELFVQPPGKKLAHIGLLSGGEKALSAIAFIFSIFLIRPSPFCILDEVDAPLDDANTERFHRLLSEMTARAQFVLITHNRRTMEKVDRLYGVTMQEPGVSQILSVRFSDAENLKVA